MYIKSIYAKNFGAISEKKVTLTDGLVVVRGRNGAGKSSMFSQIPLYAFFGTSTLSAPIADTVKTGEKALQVEVEYGPYKVCRSKASASVVGNGISISGQDQVSEFFYNLFGIHKGIEEDILVASQGDTAGIITRKKGEITSFIETIAQFSQIDELTERVKNKFPSNNISFLKELIDKDTLELSTLEEEKLEKEKEVPTIAVIEAEVQGKVASHTEYVRTAETIREIITDKETFIKNTVANNVLIALKKSTIGNEVKNKTSMELDLVQLREYLKGIIDVDAKDLEKAENIVKSSVEMRKLLKAYSWVTSLKPISVDWEGGLDSFLKEKTQKREDVDNLNKLVIVTKNNISVKSSKIVNDKTCSECGQDITHLHKELNDKNTADIEEYSKILVKATTDLSEAKTELAALTSIENENNSRLAVSKEHGEYLFNVDKTAVPFVYTWAGDIPELINDAVVIEAAKTISTNKENKKNILDFGKRIDKKVLDIATKTSEISKLTEELIKLGEVVDVTVEESHVVKAKEDLVLVTKKCEELSTEVASLNTAAVIRKEKIIAIGNNIIKTAAALKDSKKRLKGEERNAKMSKNIREARTKVLDLVWSTILDNTSQTYSVMLGRQVTLEKDVKGFRVDGLPVQRLSGSEKSTLGIALRSVLRNVFAPSCGFSIWDEPTGDCDSERTFAVMGAIQMVPGQRILITHDSELESFADQVIEIN